MEVEIIIKGGVELRKFYPEKYDKFQEAITTLVLETFPGVDGSFVTSEKTTYHQEKEADRQARREKKQEQEIKKALVTLLGEPEIQGILQARVLQIAEQPGN